MIVVDTSAIISIHAREPGHENVLARLQSQMPRFIPSTVIVEATMVLARAHDNPIEILKQYLSAFDLSVVSIDADIAAIAQQAFMQFGKGRHPARLNLGDCFSYAAARALNAPLLYVGNDFAKTDMRAA